MFFWKRKSRKQLLQEIEELKAEVSKQQSYKVEEKVKRLEKSNRNWRRKCQRLRNEKNKAQWFSEMIKPEEHKRVIVRDENGQA